MFVLAIVAILVGTAFNDRVAALRTSGIPPAVTGGLLFAALAWIARSWPGIELAWPGTMRPLRCSTSSPTPAFPRRWPNG